MSTINSLISAGASSVTGTTVSSSVLSGLSEQLEELESNTTLTDEEKQEQIDKINSQISTISSASGSVYDSASLINNMLGGSSNTDTNDFGFFFGSGYTLNNVKTLYSAGLQIQNEARVLSAQISLDKIRGVDTSAKEEKLTNLTDNVTILNNALNSQIESALADENADSETVSVIDQIKSELEANQKELDEKYNTSSSDSEEAAADSETSETSETTASVSVIDRIHAELDSNQEKLNEEFSANA